MKEKDLFVDFQPQQHVYYVEKDDNSFGPVISGSQLSKNYLDDYYLKKKNRENSLRKSLQNGEISSIYYYMELQELAIADLASRVGVCRRKVKKHFNPLFFRNISLALLEKYALVFNIPVVNLLQLIIAKEEDKDKISIEQLPTKNPLFVVTKVETK